MALRDSSVMVRLRDVHIGDQVVPKNDTMVLHLPPALDQARGVFMDGVRSFVQTAAFAFKSVEHQNEIPAIVGMTMLSLRIGKPRRVTRHTVLAGQMTKKGADKKTSHFLGQAILIVVAIPNGERWETYEEFIDNGERYLYEEGRAAAALAAAAPVPTPAYFAAPVPTPAYFKLAPCFREPFGRNRHSARRRVPPARPPSACRGRFGS